MASLRITEFGGLAAGRSGGWSVPDTPPLAHQTVTIGSETKSSALNASTRIVRLQAEGICCVEFGSSPTATTSMLRLVAGQTEYFGVAPSSKISVITTT